MKLELNPKTDIPITQIDFAPLAKYNPREFDEGHARDLLRSMNKEGIRVPFVIFDTEELHADGRLFEDMVVDTTKPYVAATGYHRQWALQRTESEVREMDIEPDMLEFPMFSIPCQIFEGNFSDFWETLYFDNTQHQVGINPLVGKNLTDKAFRQLFDSLCLLPKYLQMSQRALAQALGMAPQTAFRWREQVIGNIKDDANPLGLTDPHRDSLIEVLDSGVVVSVDGQLQPAKKPRPEKPGQAETSIAPPTDVLAKARNLVRAGVAELQQAFQEHETLSTAMSFKDFIPEVAHQFVKPVMTLESLVAYAKAPEDEITDETAIARQLGPKLLQGWQDTLAEAITAVRVNADWIAKICPDPVEEAKSEMEQAKTALDAAIDAAIARWYPQTASQVKASLTEALHRDLEACVPIGLEGIGAYEHHQGLYQEYADALNDPTDAGVWNHEPVKAFHAGILKVRRIPQVLRHFGVTDITALGEKLQRTLQEPNPPEVTEPGHRYLHLDTWQRQLDTDVTEEEEARMLAFQQSWDALGQAFIHEGAGQLLYEAINPPASNTEEDELPMLKLNAFWEAVDALPSVHFDKRIPSPPSNIQHEALCDFYPQLLETAECFDVIASALGDLSSTPKSSYLLSFFVPTALTTPAFAEFRQHLTRDVAAGKEHLAKALKKALATGQVKKPDELTPEDIAAYKHEFKLTLGEIQETVDKFYVKIAQPFLERNAAIEAHKNAYTEAYAAWQETTDLPEVAGAPASDWLVVKTAAAEHIDGASPILQREPEARASTAQVRHRKHALDALRKGITQRVAWFKALYHQKVPIAPEDEPATFEGLCGRIVADLETLMDTYPSELTEKEIEVLEMTTTLLSGYVVH